MEGEIPYIWRIECECQSSEEAISLGVGDDFHLQNIDLQLATDTDENTKEILEVEKSIDQEMDRGWNWLHNAISLSQYKFLGRSMILGFHTLQITGNIYVYETSYHSSNMKAMVILRGKETDLWKN